GFSLMVGYVDRRKGDLSRRFANCTGADLSGPHPARARCFFSGPRPASDDGPPSAGQAPRSFFRHRSLMRPTNLAQRAPATPPARRPGTTPPDPCPGPRSRSRWPVDRPTDAGGKRSSVMDRTFDRLVLEDCLAAKADGRAEPKSTGKTDA